MFQQNAAKSITKDPVVQSFNVIPEGRLINITSPYLGGGYRQDEFEISSVKHRKNSIELSFRVTEFSPDKENNFHLSAIAAQTWLQQADIILLHLEHDLERKTTEVFISENKMHYRKMITSHEVKLSLYITSKKVRRGLLFFSADISFNDNCFYGDATGIFPLPKS